MIIRTDAAIQNAQRTMSDAEDWHALDGERVLGVLGSAADTGLTTEEARRRLTQYGPNVLPETRRPGTILLLLRQFRDVSVLVLIAAAIVAAIVGEPGDIVAIVAIILVNAALGFAHEYRAERAMATLNAMAAPTAPVRRDGRESTIPAADLVPGDIVVVAAGAIVPADLRLLEAGRLRIEEAALTGESIPVEKATAQLQRADLSLGERKNMAYSGTTVSYGRGVGIVVATGIKTEFGRVAMLLGDQEESRTPLQKRLSHFGRNLAFVVLALCSVILAAGLLRGEPPTLMLMTALSLAVAAIPEALPAVVTVSLALGARKMAKQHALIRRLSAVEALGSVTFICSDKTGTLTQNRMRVEAIQTGDDPPAPLVPSTPARDPLRALLEAIALNNDSTLGPDGEPRGDPTETALYRAAATGGYSIDGSATLPRRVAELPFSSERARMTTIHQRGTELVAFTKGAPERVLVACVDRLGSNGAELLDAAGALARAEAMAASGLRVLAVAMRPLSSLPARLEDAESNQTFVGFVGLLDPPRPEARDAVAVCQSAGIRVVLMTGDHPATARAVAERLGIATGNDTVVTGPAVAAMSQAELDDRVHDIRVYARLAPEHKIRIVESLQRCGEYVAMTGDGVNDAPALRRAEIGVAMGRGGTDVAREASHMVLLDDNFATIVNAVREGRRIYDNIRRFIRYGLSTNAGEIWTLFLAPFIGLPLPLLPIHILWMNLVTDGLPGLALTAEPAERDLMRRPPRPPTESIFAHGLWQHVVWVGILMAALALGTQAWAIHIGDRHWQSMTFTVLTLSQLAHVLAIRSERESVIRHGLASNVPLLGAVVLSFAMQMAILYVPVFSRAFRTTPLTAVELLLCVAVASVVFLAVEGEKWLIRRRRLHD